MPVIVHIFTVLFAILCFMIIKKKRYKETPFICFIMFVSFISFGTASLIALFCALRRNSVIPLYDNCIRIASVFGGS